MLYVYLAMAIIACSALTVFCEYRRRQWKQAQYEIVYLNIYATYNRLKVTRLYRWFGF